MTSVNVHSRPIYGIGFMFYDTFHTYDHIISIEFVMAMTSCFGKHVVSIEMRIHELIG